MSHLKCTSLEHQQKGLKSLCVITTREERLWQDVVHSKGLGF